MSHWLDYHNDGPAFALFGAGHLLALGVVAGVIAFLLRWRNPTERARRRARASLISAFLVVEAAYLSWLLTHDAWDIREHLPLHVCSFGVWGSVLVLATRNFRVYEIIYFFGLAGATQALLTPSAGDFGLPHFRAVQTLAAHGLIVIAMVYMTAVEGFRPTLGSVWRALLAINLLALAVTGVNLLLGSNYMYTLQKPPTASLFDVMGPWPWYLLYTEFLALGLFLLLYLPFHRRSPRAGD